MGSRLHRLSCPADKEVDPIDIRIGTLASKQRGYVTRPQLRALGLDDAQILRRVRKGVLYRVHRGVYAVGHPSVDRTDQRYAAILALPAGAALGSLTTIDHSAFSRFKTTRTMIEVPRRTEVTVPGAEIHQTAAHRHGQVRQHAGVPTTTVAWAITRLGTELTQHQICNVINQASWKRRASPDEVRTLLETNRSVAGHACVAKPFRAYELKSAGSKSFLEDTYIDLVDRSTAVPYVVNTHIPTTRRSIEIDVYFPHLRLCCEVDGPPHDDPAQQAEDESRDLDLRADGYRVERFHWTEVEYRPDLCIERLRMLVGLER